MEERICVICGKRINPRGTWWIITQGWEDDEAWSSKFAHMHCMQLAIELTHKRKEELNNAAKHGRSIVRTA